MQCQNADFYYFYEIPNDVSIKQRYQFTLDTNIEVCINRTFIGLVHDIVLKFV